MEDPLIDYFVYSGIAVLFFIAGMYVMVSAIHRALRKGKLIKIKLNGVAGHLIWYPENQEIEKEDLDN